MTAGKKSIRSGKLNPTMAERGSQKRACEDRHKSDRDAGVPCTSLNCVGIKDGVVPNAHPVTGKNRKCIACHKETVPPRR